MAEMKESVKQHIRSKFNDLSQEVYSEVIKWTEAQEGTNEFDAIVLSDCLVDCMLEEGSDTFPSLAVGAMDKTTAGKLLEYVIHFCIANDIPFRKQQFYLTTDASHMLYALTMKRLCVVCGKPNSEIHHVDAVGMGRDRSKYDHAQSRFLCLCRSHHTETHQIGGQEFMSKYHVKPVKLDKEDLEKIGVI